MNVASGNRCSAVEQISFCKKVHIFNFDVQSFDVGFPRQPVFPVCERCATKCVKVRTDTRVLCASCSTWFTSSFRVGVRHVTFRQHAKDRTYTCVMCPSCDPCYGKACYVSQLLASVYKVSAIVCCHTHRHRLVRLSVFTPWRTFNCASQVETAACCCLEVGSELNYVSEAETTVVLKFNKLFKLFVWADFNQLSCS